MEKKLIKDRGETGKLEVESLEKRLLLSNYVPELPYEHDIYLGVKFSPYDCKLTKAGEGTWEVYNGELYVDLYDTTAKSSFTIKGNAKIGDILVDGDLKRFKANYSDVTGSLTLNGFVKKATLDDVLLGDVFIDGNKEFEARGDIKNSFLCVYSENGKVNIKGSIIDAEEVTVDYVRSFSVKGDIKNSLVDVFGDIGKKAKINGSVTDSEVWIDGVKEGFVGGGITNSYFVFCSGKSLSVKEDIVNSYISILDIKNFSAKGRVIDSVLESTEILKKAVIGSDFNHSGLYVGYYPGENGVPGGDFDEIYDAANIFGYTKVNIKGQFRNSWLGTVDAFKSVKLSSVVFANNDVEHGIFYGDYIGKLKIAGKRYYPPSYMHDFAVDELENIVLRRPPSDPPFL